MTSTAKTSTVFDILALLTDEQRKAIGTRFNKTWLTPRMAQVESYQVKHDLDFFTAAFTVSLLEDASNLVSARKVAKVADTMYSLSSELFGSDANKDAALLQIQTAYENLDTIQAPQAGKRFRQLVTKNFTVAMSQKILTLVCEKLDTQERDWL